MRADPPAQKTRRAVKLGSVTIWVKPDSGIIPNDGTSARRHSRVSEVTLVDGWWRVVVRYKRSASIWMYPVEAVKMILYEQAVEENFTQAVFGGR